MSVLRTINGDIELYDPNNGTALIQQNGDGIDVPNGDLTVSSEIYESTERVATRTWVNDNSTAYTDEDAQDAVGTILGSNFTYDDANDSITLSNDSVTINAGSELSGGGTVSLGGSTTINFDVNSTVYFDNQEIHDVRLENRTSEPGILGTGKIWIRTDL